MNSSFPVFLVGYMVLIAGVAYGLHAAGVGAQWIITAVLILAGVGIIGSLSRAKQTSAPAEGGEQPRVANNR